MTHTMFKADGKPCRATVRPGTWVLDVTFEPHSAPPPPRHLVAHEAAHVVQGVTVRGWDIKKKKPVIGHAPTPYMPAVDDEVLVMFEHGQQRTTAIQFNPYEISAKKSNPPTVAKGDVGMVHAGNYRVVIRQRGTQPFPVYFVIARDAAMQTDVHAVRLF